MVKELMAFRGLPFPRTASGDASMLPPTPWHYSGDLLTVEYRTDPANVRAVLPPDVELANDDEDPGAVAFIWADWQSCGDDGELELWLVGNASTSSGHRNGRG